MGSPISLLDIPFILPFMPVSHSRMNVLLFPVPYLAYSTRPMYL